FALDNWRHVALYNGTSARIEMHLEATRAHAVHWASGERVFAAGERIHTENSYKWTPDGFDQLLHAAGFPTRQRWCDPLQRFSVYWAQT
ncbi:MAG: L-histidine N(alpha)-methyltransferase, partial [Pseudomonadota bacterium]